MRWCSGQGEVEDLEVEDLEVEDLEVEDLEVEALAYIPPADADGRDRSAY